MKNKTPITGQPVIDKFLAEGTELFDLVPVLSESDDYYTQKNGVKVDFWFKILAANLTPRDFQAILNFYRQDRSSEGYINKVIDAYAATSTTYNSWYFWEDVNYTTKNNIYRFLMTLAVKGVWCIDVAWFILDNSHVFGPQCNKELLLEMAKHSEDKEVLTYLTYGTHEKVKELANTKLEGMLV